MEKNTIKTYSKRTKWIVSIIIGTVILASTVAITCLLRLPMLSTYTVEYIKGIGDSIVQTYKKGEKINFPETPIKNGYVFLGWSLDKNNDDFVTTEVVVNKELTLYAKWEEKTYSINYNGKTISVGYNTKIYQNNQNIYIETIEDTLCFEAPIKSNYEFISWQIKSNNKIYDIKDINLNQLESTNLELIPQYKQTKINYFITGNLQNFIINTSSNGTIEINKPIEFSITLDESVNKSNIKVYVNNEIINYTKDNNNYIIKIDNCNKDLNIYIDNIEKNKYTVNYIYDDKNITTTQTHGEYLNIPNLQKEGYDLLSLEDKDKNTYSNEFIITQDLTLYPIWKIKTLNVTFPKNNGSYILKCNQKTILNENPININYNEKIDLSITLSKAYNNSKINLYALSNNQIINPKFIDGIYTFENIKNDIAIIIDNIEINSYSLIVDGKNYGKFIYGSWISVNENNIQVSNHTLENPIIISPLIKDQNFNGWTLNHDNLLTNNFIQDLEKNNTIELNGKYSIKVARIKLEPNGGDVSPTEIIYIEGENITLPTPQKEGYKFAGWYTKIVEINKVIDKNQSEQFTLITDTYMIIYAGWEKK